MRVLERSVDSLDSQGNPLSFPMVGLPLKSVFYSTDYTVEVSTPLNTFPVAFLKAYDKGNLPLKIEGADIVDVKSATGAGLDGYQYSFLIAEAKGDSLNFRVFGNEEIAYEYESLKFELVSRGQRWVIDAI